MNKQNRQRKKLAKKHQQTDRDRPTDTPKERKTDRHTDGEKKTKTKKTEGWKPTWALVQSTFLGLVVMRTAAFPAKIRRWICTGAIALPCASTTGITTARPRTPTTPTAMHYKLSEGVDPPLNMCALRKPLLVIEITKEASYN